MCAYGELGSGKTLSIVKEAVRFHMNYPDLPIYSNILLKTVPFRKIDSAAVLFDINESCFVLLDELWHLADSRKGQSLINDVMNMLLLRSRKKRWRVGYTQQWWTQTDLRIRYITELFIEPQIIERGGLQILREDFYDKHGTFLRSRGTNAAAFYEDYDTEADPYTLNIEELKTLWRRYREKQGFA